MCRVTSPSPELSSAQFISVNDASLAFDVHGDPDAPAIVLLHGLGGSRSSWDGIAEALAAQMRVYVLDMRGHGESDWPGDYSFELMSEDVLGFLEALDLRDATLVGHSMGGVAILLAAQASTTRIAKIVLEDTPLPRPDKAGTRPRERPDGPLSFDWDMVEAIVGQLNHPGAHWWDGLPQVDVPALLIAGGPSSTVNQELIAQMATTIPEATLLTIPVGHHVHVNRPHEFLDAVTTFLSG
jgi:pimeloyl-ACP methyl ester carboxylesterase